MALNFKTEQSCDQLQAYFFDMKRGRKQRSNNGQGNQDIFLVKFTVNQFIKFLASQHIPDIQTCEYYQHIGGILCESFHKKIKSLNIWASDFGKSTAIDVLLKKKLGTGSIIRDSTFQIEEIQGTNLWKKDCYTSNELTFVTKKLHFQSSQQDNQPIISFALINNAKRSMSDCVNCLFKNTFQNMMMIERLKKIDNRTSHLFQSFTEIDRKHKNQKN